MAASMDYGRVRAPRFPDGLRWLNTARPLALDDLRGRVTVLDFWTLCCINCHHVLSELASLEQKYADQPVTVIGVHSPKFPHERDEAAVREAVLRHDIAHPVVLDNEFEIWGVYGVRAWPTLVVIDPKGYVVGLASGEGNRDLLDQAVAALLDEQAGALDRRPVPVRLEREAGSPTPLRYPGKVLADPAGGRLFVADSGHHRIVIASLDGRTHEVVGTGEAGRADGAFEEATFRAPQGMALAPGGDALFVADTENHLVRRLDLHNREVTTVAGSGEQARGRVPGGAQGALTTALNSPWDLCFAPDEPRYLFIAMAGSHQLWVRDLTRGVVGIYAGTGAEGRRDGPGDQAAFAQPSGIDSDGRYLYVADSEISAVRRVEIGGAAEVVTLAGGDLFEFGDADGVGDEVRLQHPLGVACHDGQVYLADTYNGKVKRLDPGSGRVKTLLDDFSEPGGLSIAGGTLYVADTNRHRIVRIELASGERDDVVIDGLCSPTACFPG